MTRIEGGRTLAGIAEEAQVELDAAALVGAEEPTPGDGALAASVAELGYYEAELSSLRDAATTIEEPERG